MFHIFLILFLISSHARLLCAPKSPPLIAEGCSYDRCHEKKKDISNCDNFRILRIEGNGLFKLPTFCIGVKPCYLKDDGGISNTDTHLDPRRDRIVVPKKTPLQERPKYPLDREGCMDNWYTCRCSKWIQ